MKYFRSLAATYINICAMLDAAYGYPNAETKTERTLPLVSELPADSAGRVYLVMSSRECEYEVPSQILPDLLANGDVEEITAEEYMGVFPPPADLLGP
jgi:hypothetical protein